MIDEIKLRLEEIISYEGFRRYAKNTIWLFAENILRLIAGFFVGVWVARYLGPEKFGIFSYALAFSSIFLSISKLGLDSIVVRELVKEPLKAELYLGTSFWLKFFGSGISFLIVVVILFFAGNDKQTNIYILIISLGMFFQSFEVIDFYFQSRVLAKFVSISKMIQLFISSIIKVYLILIKADLFWFVLVTLLDIITLSISLFIVYRRYVPFAKNFLKYFDKNIAKVFLKESWPLILSSFAIMVYMRIDQVMIKYMLGEKSVGLYSAAVRLSEIWYFIPTIITTSVFPAIVNAKKVDINLYYQRILNLYGFIGWAFIILSVIITFLSTFVIVKLYGMPYYAAKDVLMILIWNSVLIAFGAITGRIVVVNNKQTNSLIATLIGAGSNIFLNFLLIDRFGIKGAAFATIIAQIISGFVVPVYFKVDARYPAIVFKSLFYFDYFKRTK
ncbi:MAG: flippase [Elusimicrobiota bacterium]